MTITDETIVEITNSITSFVSDSSKNIEDQSTENLEKIATVFENVTTLLENDGLTVDTEVWTYVRWRRLVVMAVLITTGARYKDGSYYASRRGLQLEPHSYLFVYMTFLKKDVCHGAMLMRLMQTAWCSKRGDVFTSVLFYLRTINPMPSFCGSGAAIFTFFWEIEI